MLVSEFDYHLPQELIAQEPVEPRDASRLLVVNRKTGELFDRHFYQLGEWLQSGDVLVLNNTRVIPARVYGRLSTGARLELLLLRRTSTGMWEVLTRPARKAKPGTVVEFEGFRAVVVERRPEGIRLVRFEPDDINRFYTHGELALPPYIKTGIDKPERYQTIFAQIDGAVAAPTAGLHFTRELIDRLASQGVQFVYITLHAGLGTFRPVKATTVEEHKMYPEEFEISPATAQVLNKALTEQRRIVCVGTTTVRALEFQAERVDRRVEIKPGRGETSLYIYPGYDWKVTDALITNFHLPKSTLLLLVCAFAGRDLTMRAYRHAIERRYRFFSFGDAMLIL
ncbi:MAG: tRNA preQ1(34) S-adenosylmethionine ribosyltransferase-isomerase QueA [candidate division WOR-3 bacterium]|jgi:S-adenosylmethionine:tRNA ribosyltransferase-isomerase